MILEKYNTYFNKVYDCKEPDYGYVEIPELLLEYYNNSNKNKLLFGRIITYSCIGILGKLIMKNWKYDITKYIVSFMIDVILIYPNSKYYNKNIKCGTYCIYHKSNVYKSSIFNYYNENGEIYTSKLYGINNYRKSSKLLEIYEFIKHEILGFDIVSNKNPYVKYEGRFKKLQYHGDGKLYHSNGKLFIEGDFYEGLPIWAKKIYLDNGKLLFENKAINIM